MIASEVGTVTILCGIVTGTVLGVADCRICLCLHILKQIIVTNMTTVMKEKTSTGVRKIKTVPASGPDTACTIEEQVINCDVGMHMHCQYTFG